MESLVPKICCTDAASILWYALAYKVMKHTCRSSNADYDPQLMPILVFSTIVHAIINKNKKWYGWYFRSSLENGHNNSSLKNVENDETFIMIVYFDDGILNTFRLRRQYIPISSISYYYSTLLQCIGQLAIALSKFFIFIHSYPPWTLIFIRSPNYDLSYMIYCINYCWKLSINK